MKNMNYLITRDEVISQFNEKILLYSMLKQLTEMIGRMPSNRGSKELSNLSDRFDAEAEMLFESWGVPKSYLIFGEEEELGDLFRDLCVLIDADDMDEETCPYCNGSVCICDEDESEGCNEEEAEEAQIRGLGDTLAPVLREIFGDGILVHVCRA